MKQIIRLTETDIHKIIKETVKKALNENNLTNKQAKNITGIQDDYEFYDNVIAEVHEELESKIWNSLSELANGENPRNHSYNFKDVCSMLYKNFGFKYAYANEENEGHEFSNGYSILVIFPNVFYPRQGTLKITNLYVY